MYANLEEEYGLARRAMQIYDRATRTVPEEDKFAMFSLYILRAAEFFGITKTR
jgi:pre-mRNA-splicing factor SYF1